MLLSALLACTGSLTVKDAEDPAGSDSGDTDSGDTDDSAEPQTDFTQFTGTRNFYADYTEYGDEYYCDEDVAETGELVEEGSSLHDELRALCGVCEYFYEVSPEADEACEGYLNLGTTWRGVLLTEAGGIIYLYTEYDGELYSYAEDSSASFDGTDLAYTYTTEIYNYFDVAVTGLMSFPLTP